MTKVDSYISKHSNWEEELKILRSIFLETRLKETIKWSAPVYCINGKNVAGIGAFKKHFGIWFFQGALLKDEKKLLINAQEGKTKALRQMRFSSKEEINKDVLRLYIEEAITNQELDREVAVDRTKKELEIPLELISLFSEDDALKTAFVKLTYGKQKEYCNYISEAKREETKLKRIEKIFPMIMRGVGLYDKYKNC